MDPAALSGLLQQGNHPPQDYAKLLGYFAQEMQLFFGHLQTGIAQFQETGELPHSMFKAKEVQAAAAAAGRKRKSLKERGKRKPSVFNIFVREKMEELRARGAKPAGGEAKGNNVLFSMAVAEWAKLSAEQKKAYTDTNAPLIAAAAAGELLANGHHAEEEAGSVEESEEHDLEEEEEEEEDEDSEEEPSPPPATKAVEALPAKKEAPAIKPAAPTPSRKEKAKEEGKESPSKQKKKHHHKKAKAEKA